MSTEEKNIVELGLISQIVYGELEKNKKRGATNTFEDDEGRVVTLSNTYKVIDYTDEWTDMQALLLERGETDNNGKFKGSGEYVLAFRGTKGWADIGVDVIIGLGNINIQYGYALEFTYKALAKIAKDKGCSIEEAKSCLTLTGHSLGGILTQQVGANLHIKGYAYNPYGVDRLLSLPPNYPGISDMFLSIALYKIMETVGLTKVHANWAYEHISTISYQDEGTINGDMLSNLATNVSSAHLGKFIPILGKDVGARDGHGIANLNRNIAEYNNILKHFNSSITYRKLTEAYLATAMIYQGKGYETLQNEFKKLGVFESQDNSLNLDIITSGLNLQNAFSPKSIATPALYALIHLNPFIVSNINSPVYKELEKHRNEYSDNYIKDRSKMFEAVLVYPDKKPVNFNYFDKESKKELYSNPASNTDKETDIIFGTDSDETIQARIHFKNRIYALAGDDHIIAGKGDNYIEAGSGNDAIDLRGSKGENTVYGGVNNDKEDKDYDDGDDTIYGGEGKDTIYGGSGKDTIYTDNDDKEDLLYGGDGFDTYYAGDKDIIEDTDGQGRVFFNDSILTGGTYDKEKGVYLSEDGKTEYKLLEDEKLIVKKDGGIVTINGYKKDFKDESGNAYLSITLLDSDEIGISISDNQTNEGDSGKKSLDFNISLQGSIEKGEFLILGVGDKKYLFGDPSEEYIKKYNLNLAQYERGNTYTYTWDGNTIKQEDRKFDVTPRIIQTSDKLKAKILKSGTGKIIDDDEDDSPNDTFPDTTPASTKTSPIVIDLNGDGVKTISRKNGKTYFDLDNNKFAENTSWIDKNDGILINKTLIANSITNGSELFGNHTLLRDGSLANNGFEALKEFDENKDGVINELDTLAYKSLAIWQDKNEDAKLDENELKSLKELGIKEINLGYTNSNFIDENGNEHRQTSNITFTNGNTTTISDVWLDTFTADTRYVGEKIVLSAEIEALPQIYAFGEVLNLHQAMAKDKVLQTMVQNYIASDKAKQNEIINDIIYRWANSDQIEPNARDPKKIYSHVMDARQLVALEHLTGKGYLGIWCWGEYDPNPHGQAAPLLIDEFNKFAKYVQAQISAQSEFKDLFAGILPLQWEKNQTGDLRMAFKALKDRIADLLPNVDYANISADNIIRARELINTAKNLGTYNTKYQSVFETIEAGWLSEIENLKFVINSVEGTAGNDNLSGDNKDNIIIGGRGDDTLFGGAGNDMYYFDILFGKDRVYDSAGVDGIVFSKNIKPENIELTRNKTSIYITRLDDNKAKTNDVIQIDNFFEYNGDIGNGAIEKIIFQNGIQWDINKIIEILAPQPTQGNDNLYGDMKDNIISGLGGDDIIYGGNGNDTINGNDGNDELHGDDGNDQLFGGDGNDTLYGENGNDTLIGGMGSDNLQGGDGNDTLNGGLGNDTLNGGYGDDTYIFNKGDGADTITDYGGNNILKLGAGLDKKDLIVSRNSNGYILLSFKDNASDSITLTSPNIQVVEFANGDKMNIDEIKKLSLIGDDADNTIYGYYNENNTLIGNGGNDTIRGDNGNDILIGGKGDDILHGGYGDDTYIFNKGDGNDIIVDYGGINTLQFGEGISRNDLEFNTTNLGSDLKISFKNSPNDSIILNQSSVKNIRFASGEILNLNDINAIKITGTEGSDVIRAGINIPHIIEGGNGNDDIRGNDYTKSISGGKGNDKLYGGSGDNIYIFNKGDGADIIYDMAGKDEIQFKEGVAPNDVNFKRELDKLIISIKSNDDSITIQNFFSVNPEIGNNTVRTITFADGTVYDFNKILELTPLSSTDKDDKLYLTDGNDTFDAGLGNDEIWSGNGDDIINGREGGDTLYGNNGNDTLNGGSGNDTLYGGYGNDTIMGGEGDDILDGGYGDDTYIFSKGHGNDIITDDEGVDTIEFGKGILKEDLIISRSNAYNIIVQFKNNPGDKITINRVDRGNIEKFEFSDGTIINLNDIKAKSIIGTQNDDIIYGFNEDNVLKGGGGNDILYGSRGNDIIEGNEGNDALHGNSGNDTLIGGAGNDTLNGGYGDDIYIFDKGDGSDIIDDYQGTDTIKFGEGISKEDLIISRRNAYNIIVRFKNNPGDTITLDNRTYIERFEFADGTFMNLNDIKTKSLVGTQDDDVIYGYDGDNILKGGGGNDSLIGGKGNDIIEGDEGDDWLFGNHGNDTLTGGSGNDILKGSDGDDIYIFNKGDGNDTIYDENGKDTIKFNDFNADDITLKREFKNLIISSKISKDVITINDFFHAYNGYDYAIENIIFKDGSVWDYKAILDNSAIKATEGDDKICLGNGDDNFNALGGDDEIYGEGGNDTIAGGDGNDNLDGGEGDDILYGNKGDDILSGGNGNDTLNGGGGDDKLYGWDGDDTIVGENGNDILNGGNGSDTLNGGAGNDIINGDEGNDTLIGGKNDDILNGGYGDDAYIFNRGDGKDTITDNQGTDTVKFGEGISKEDLIVKRVARMNDYTKRKEYSDIVILFKNSPNDSITLRDVTHGNSINENNVIETFEFSNGDKLSFEDIKKLSLIGSDSSENIVGYVHTHNIIKGEGGDDKLYGQGWNDTMYGGDGNDLIEGGSGNDILIGDKGNDTLKGGIGDDILIGGIGDDTLNGGADNDTYVYNKGDGNDIVEDSDGVDTLKFGEGIQKEDLIVSTNINKKWSYLNNATDIIIKFKHNEADSITLKNVLTANKTRIDGAIENFEFANGEKLSFEDIKQLSLVGTNEGETINGFEDSNNTLIGNGGNDWLYGDEKNDILIGGEGDDYLGGRRGDDTYVYNIGDGNDTIYDYEGEDIIKFGKGINKEDIIVTKSKVKYDSYSRLRYQDLVISLKGKQGSISLEHTISEDGSINESYTHKTLVFENGDKLSFEDILKLSLTGDDEDNHISGYKYRNDTIEGKGGNDILSGDEGNDTLIGGEGNDRLGGGEGNDILIGGEGDDTLEGFRGDDTYIFNKGDGNDTIEEYFGNDTLKFGEGISKEDIIVKKNGYGGAYSNDIVISFKNNPTDSITLKDVIRMNEANKNKMIENFIFSNGDKLSFDDIRQLSLIGSNEKDDIKGYNDLNNIFQGMDGDDNLWGQRTDETFIGGKGNDYLGGDGGDDTYIFSPGDGNDIIFDYKGTNILQFTEGITKDDLLIGLEESRFIIRFKNSNDSIWFPHTSIKKIQFFNGDELSYEEMKKLALTGTDGDDIMSSCNNEDTVFIGGKGNDTLIGGSGNDTYIFNKGDGADSIRDENGNDTIKFGNGIRKNDLIIKRGDKKDLYEYDDVIISFKNSPNDSIAIKNIIADNKIRPSGIIENFEFASGEKLSFEDIKQLSLVGTNKDDLIKGYNDMDNVIEGKAGNDTLIGANYYDGYGQKDGSYKNTFVFSKGDGADTIAGINNEDLIKFKDIGKNEVKFELNPANKTLLISNTVSNDTVLIEDYSTTSGYNYEKRRNFVTNLNIEFKDGITLNNDFILKNAKLKGDANTMIGGKEDNVFTYDGGAKTIMDLGGYDKVIYKNPVKRVRYDYGENGSDDLRLIITPADPNAKNDILEVKGFFSNRDNVIEEFRIGKYLNIKAADIYRAFGMDYQTNNAKAASLANATETFSLAAKPTALAMNTKLDIDHEARISPLSKSSGDSSNSKSGWDIVLGSGDKNELKAIVSEFYNDTDLSTSKLNSALNPSDVANLNTISSISQEDALKDDAFLSQDTVNKIIEQLNVYADSSEALEFNQRDIRKDDMQVYMS